MAERIRDLALPIEIPPANVNDAAGVRGPYEVRQVLTLIALIFRQPLAFILRW